MKSLIVILSYMFSALEMLTTILVFPLTILCGLGLLGFTIKIAREMKVTAARKLNAPPDMGSVPA